MSSKTIFWQRFEGLMIFLASIYFYAKIDYSWWWFALFLLSFDLSMIGYLKDDRLGALIYNLGHSYVLPVILLIWAFQADSSLALASSTIWFAHIGMDRAAGYGLKTEEGFSHTHLGLIFALKR